MIHSAITISLVEQARGGPFVLWDDLATSCAKAAALGFDAVEIFAPSAEHVDPIKLKPILQKHNLKVAALGTGAGWVIHKLHLCSSDAGVRRAATDFIRSIIDRAAEFDAPAIIGSMQGKAAPQLPDAVEKTQAMQYLAAALEELGAHAASRGQILIYEPLNRYETNLVNTIEAGVNLLNSLKTKNVRLLADLFHMNIEERDIAAALRAGAGHVGHLHLADSNRRAAGCGHTDLAPIAAALRETGYDGYASAEVLAWPNPDEAARLAMAGYKRFMAS